MWGSGAQVQPELEGAKLVGVPCCGCYMFLERRVEALSPQGQGF